MGNMEKAILFGSILAGIATLIGVAIYFSNKYEQARTEKFRELAQEMGLQFDAQAAEGIANEIAGLRLFDQGHSRRFKNLLRGKAQGVELAIFEYRYIVGHGKHQTSYEQSVVFFRTPGLALPVFELCPENFLHRIGQAFGYQDIDFDSHPVFSKAYLLRGEDEDAIRQCFTPNRIDFFESMTGVSVEAKQDRLVFYRSRKRVKPEDFRSLMADGFRVYKLFDEKHVG